MAQRASQAISVLTVCFAAFASSVVVSAIASSSGGHGWIGTKGRVANLRLDQSTRDAVIAFAGRPDADKFDSIGVPGFPSYEALGYGCQRRRGRDLGFTSGFGPYCRVVFYISRATYRLEAFFAATSRYMGPGGIHRGMSTAQAERRVHKRAISGCGRGIFLGSKHTRAWLVVDVDGGRDVSRGSGALGIIGGRVGFFELESTRHPVGLEFC